MAQNDMAGGDYWEKNWSQVQLPRTISPRKNPIDARFVRMIRHRVPRGGRFLEIGCAASAWMPFFAQSMDADVWGVDYSPAGIEEARKNMDLQGVHGRLVLGDFLKPELLEPATFRVILSRGVIEHYQDPTPIFKRARELLEPGGVKVTIIPNTAGLWGRLQKAIDEDIYHVHMPFRGGDLDRFQQAAGLEPVVRGTAFGVWSFGVLNWSPVHKRLRPFFSRVLAYGLQSLDRLAGWGTYGWAEWLNNDWSSPYFVSIYQKPK